MNPLPAAPVRIDADLFDDLADPSRRTAYPSDSRGYVRIDMSLRSYWHTLFDTCPLLLELTGPTGAAIFDPFMAWAKDQKLSFGWTYFLWVHRWLQQSEFCERLNEDILLSIMTASATRWMMLDRDPDSCMIVLGSASLKGAVVASKYNTIYSGLEQVEHVEFETPLPAPAEGLGYFVAQSFEIDRFPGWSRVPR